MRLDAEQPRRVRKHRSRIGFCKPFATEQVEEDLRVAPPHVGIALAFGRLVSEIAPAVDHLLGRAAADAELEPSAGDQVGTARVLHHVERVLVAHVDHGRADLDRAGLGADGREQRKRRSQLPCEMVHAEVGAVGAELLSRDRQLDRLQQRVAGGAGLRLRRGRPVPEGEESDLFHAGNLGMIGIVCETLAEGKMATMRVARKCLLKQAGRLGCSPSPQISQRAKFSALSKPPNALSRQDSLSLAAFAR